VPFFFLRAPTPCVHNIACTRGVEEEIPYQFPVVHVPAWDAFSSSGILFCGILVRVLSVLIARRSQHTTQMGFLHQIFLVPGSNLFLGTSLP
jgi:uncharacterized membrane protein